MGNYVTSLKQRVADYSERNGEIVRFRNKMRCAFRALWERSTYFIRTILQDRK